MVAFAPPSAACSFTTSSAGPSPPSDYVITSLPAIAPNPSSAIDCNQQFSIVALTDSAGNVVERYSYSAYGEPKFLDPNGNELSSSNNLSRFLYSTREWDPLILLFHLRARMYSPTIGRFLSRDPIEYTGSLWNLYEYCGGSPIRFIDPFGLDRIGLVDEGLRDKLRTSLKIDEYFQKQTDRGCPRVTRIRKPNGSDQQYCDVEICRPTGRMFFNQTGRTKEKIVDIDKGKWTRQGDGLQGQAVDWGLYWRLVMITHAMLEEYDFFREFECVCNKECCSNCSGKRLVNCYMISAWVDNGSRRSRFSMETGWGSTFCNEGYCQHFDPDGNFYGQSNNTTVDPPTKPSMPGWR